MSKTNHVAHESNGVFLEIESTAYRRPTSVLDATLVPLALAGLLPQHWNQNKADLMIEFAFRRTWALPLLALSGCVLLAVGISTLAARTTLGQRLSGHVISVVVPPPKATAIRGEAIELKATLAAIGSRDVRVVGAKLPCGCMGLSPLPLDIPAGEEREILIKVDTSQRKSLTYSGEIPLIINVAAPPVSIPVRYDLTE